MPSAASLAASQYYGLPRNAFWAIMGELFGAGRELPYSERLQILQTKGIALWDVLKACEREGSLDSSIDLRTAEVNDFPSFFRRHRTIKRVYFNGSKAAEIYRRRVLPEVQLEAPYLAHERLPSTSPAMAALNLEQKLAAWSVLKPARDAP